MGSRVPESAPRKTHDAMPLDPDNDLDRSVICDICREPYLIRKTYDAIRRRYDKRLFPAHKPWCRWHRATSKGTTR